jgi:hypothetical protein
VSNTLSPDVCVGSMAGIGQAGGYRRFGENACEMSEEMPTIETAVRSVSWTCVDMDAARSGALGVLGPLPYLSVLRSQPDWHFEGRKTQCVVLAEHGAGGQQRQVEAVCQIFGFILADVVGHF